MHPAIVIHLKILKSHFFLNFTFWKKNTYSGIILRGCLNGYDPAKLKTGQIKVAHWKNPRKIYWTIKKGDDRRTTSHLKIFAVNFFFILQLLVDHHIKSLIKWRRLNEIRRICFWAFRQPMICPWPETKYHFNFSCGIFFYALKGVKCLSQTKLGGGCKC